jgi:hypothetical protein
MGGDRRAGQSGIVVCPSAQVPHDLVRALDETCPRGVAHHELPADDEGRLATEARASAHVRLLSLVSERLGMAPHVDPAAFCDDPALGRQSLAIDARAVPLDVQWAWCDLAARVAEGAKPLPAAVRPGLWVVVAPIDGRLPDLPDKAACLRTKWYWGILSPIDTLVAASILGIDEDRAACAVEVARWDLDALEDLAGWDGTVEGLAGRDGRWPEVDGQHLVTIRQAPGRPPDELVSAWARGLVQSWDGHLASHIAVERVHRDSAALTRVWAGQVARLFPFIELERARLAEWLGAELRRRNGVSREWAAEHGKDVALLEVGPLLACVHAHDRVRVPKARLRLLQELVKARNALAHRRALAPGTVQRIRRLAEEDRAAA